MSQPSVGPKPEWVRLSADMGWCEPLVRRVLGWEGSSPRVNNAHNGRLMLHHTSIVEGPWEPCDSPFEPTKEPAAAPESGEKSPPLDDALRAMRKRAALYVNSLPGGGVFAHVMADFAASEVAARDARIAEVERRASKWERKFSDEVLAAEGYIKQRDEQRERADKAEARVRDLEADLAEARAAANNAIADARVKDGMLPVNLDFSRMSPSGPVREPTPAADLGALTKEDRAWMDARQATDAEAWGPQHALGAAAKAAVAARKGGK